MSPYLLVTSDKIYLFKQMKLGIIVVCSKIYAPTE